mmetsp:Transcript_23844/g.44044  ORF Transcript_23844/g.44044 Transcript_23844/m.44044 type:complete len:231 (+) Transcript_23844:160-852(+)
MPADEIYSGNQTQYHLLWDDSVFLVQSSVSSPDDLSSAWNPFSGSPRCEDESLLFASLSDSSSPASAPDDALPSSLIFCRTGSHEAQKGISPNRSRHTSPTSPFSRAVRNATIRLLFASASSFVFSLFLALSRTMYAYVVMPSFLRPTWKNMSCPRRETETIAMSRKKQLTPASASDAPAPNQPSKRSYIAPDGGSLVLCRKYGTRIPMRQPMCTSTNKKVDTTVLKKKG